MRVAHKAADSAVYRERTNLCHKTSSSSKPPLTHSSVDHITDFERADDAIELETRFAVA